MSCGVIRAVGFALGLLIGGCTAFVSDDWEAHLDYRASHRDLPDTFHGGYRTQGG